MVRRPTPFPGSPPRGKRPPSRGRRKPAPFPGSPPEGGGSINPLRPAKPKVKRKPKKPVPLPNPKKKSPALGTNTGKLTPTLMPSRPKTGSGRRKPVPMPVNPKPVRGRKKPKLTNLRTGRRITGGSGRNVPLRGAMSRRRTR